MNRNIRLFLAGFLSLVLLTTLVSMVFFNKGSSTSGPVTQLEIYLADDVLLTDIDPSN